jgi:small subunit ribosomal protein S8
MNANDPIGDMLTRMRNALAVGHPSITVQRSNLKVEVARILKEEGFIESFIEGGETGKPTLTLDLKYYGKRRTRRPVITELKRISTPGRRVYVSRDEIPWVLSGMGVAILSTSQGVMTGTQARRKGIGGEVLATIY